MRNLLALIIIAALQASNINAQDASIQGISGSLNIGMSLPTGKEISTVFNQGLVIRPALQKGFLLPQLKGEIAFDVVYHGNEYRNSDGEARDNLWMYGISANVLYDVTLSDKLKLIPKLGIGYTIGRNYLTSDDEDFGDKQNALQSRGLSINPAICIENKRINLTISYSLQKPTVELDGMITESLGSFTSDLYGKTVTTGIQKMDFSYLSFSVGYKFLQL